MKKKNVIWSNIGLDEEGWREGYEEWMELNDLTPETTDKTLYEWMVEENNSYLEDEHINLDVDCGKIIAIAQLGLWDGHHQGFKIFEGRNLTDIFGISEVFSEYYCDAYNVRGKFIHHDGTNTVLYREIKEDVNIEPFLHKIWEGEEIDSRTLSRYTKSLRPYVKQVYGFK